MYQDGLVDGLYFALPTRSAASQLHQRVNRFISNLFPDGPKPEPVLAVPGYLKAGDFTGQHLSRYEVCWEDHAGHDAVGKFWAAESAKRFLAAQIAVGTVDQAMMGALKVRHAHMRTACLARNLLVIDEVHASDTYMRAIIEALLDAHTDAGGYALLMSATLGSAARQSLLFRGPPPEVPEHSLAGRSRSGPLPGGHNLRSIRRVGVRGVGQCRREARHGSRRSCHAGLHRRCPAGVGGGPSGSQGAGDSQHRQLRHRDPPGVAGRGRIC